MKKDYKGVGAHLFAYACKRSFEDGYDGFVYFIAKSRLISYYSEALGAIQTGRSSMMIIDASAARKLVQKYYESKAE